MTENVEELSVGFKDGVSAGVKTATDNVTGLGAAATVAEGNVDRLGQTGKKAGDTLATGMAKGKTATDDYGASVERTTERVTRQSLSVEQLANKYDRTQREALLIAKATAEYRRHLEALEKSTASAADKETQRANILALIERATERARAANNKLFDDLEKGANAASAAVGGWASGMSAVYAVAETASNGVYGVAKALQAVDASFRAGHTGFSEWAAAAKGLEASLRGVSAAQRSINDAVGLSRQTANTATIGPTRYATTGAVSGAGTITFGDDGSAQRLDDLNAAFAAGADELDAYRVSLGLVDVAQRKYEAGLVDLESMIRRVGVEEAEANRLRTAYAAANDPAQKRAAETAAENARLSASYGSVMNALDPAHAAQVRYDKALSDVRAGAVAAGRSEAELAADIDRVTAALSPAAIAAKKEEAALQSLMDRADPAAAKMRALSADLKLLNDAAAKGDPQVVGRVDELTAGLKRQHGVLDASASKTKLAAHEVTNLSYQFQDFAVQVGSGQGLFLPLLQQGPQAVGAVGGLERAMALLATPMTAIVLTAAAVAGGLALIGARAVENSAHTRELTVTMRAYGTEAQATAVQLRDVSKALYEGGAGRSESFAVGKMLASTRGVSAALGRELAVLGSDMAAGLGQSVDDAVKGLVKLKTEGQPAILQLQESIGFLTPAEVEAVRVMGEHGKQAEALGVVLGALHRRFDGLRKDSLSPAGTAMHDLGVQFNRMVDTAANSKITIGVTVALSDTFKALADFIENPSLGGIGKVLNANPVLRYSPGGLFANALFGDDDPAALRQKIADAKSQIQGLETGRLLDPAQSRVEINRRQDDIAALEKRLAAITRTISTVQGGVPSVRAANDLPELAPAAVDPGVNQKSIDYVDELTRAYHRQSEALRGNAVQRALAQADLRAEDEIAKNNISGAEAITLRIIRQREALRDLTLAVDDARRAAEADIAGNGILARAYGVSGAAVHDAQIQQKALTEAARGSVEPYDAIVSRLRAMDDAQRAVQAAQFSATLRDQAADALRLADAWGKGAAAAREATLANEVLAEARKRGLDPTRDAGELNALGQGVLARDLAQRSQQFAQMAAEQRQAVELANAEYAMLGQSNAERARAVAILQTSNDLRAKGADLTDLGTQAYIRQQGELARVNSQLQDAAQQAANIAQPITSSFEDVVVGAKKASEAGKALAEDLKRLFVRSVITKPAETWLSGTLTQLMSGGVVTANDNAPKPANDPGQLTRILGSVNSGLGASAANALWVQVAGASAAGALAALPPAAAPTSGLPLPVAIKDGGQVVDALRSEARAQGVPEEVVLAVAKIESNFRQYDQQGRVTTSSAGAQGVMQLMPGTAKWLGVDASDTLQNVQGGVRYLAMLGRQFGGDWVKAAGAYNAGPTRMTDWVDRGRALPAETTSYMGEFSKAVKAVGGDVGQFGGRIADASQATTGVTAAQESALQVQFDAITAGKAQAVSVQMLTQDQEALVDSVLGVTKPMGDAAGAATAFGDAATSGADTFLGGLQKMLGGASDFFSDLLGVGGTSSVGSSGKQVLRNADGSTSYAPTVKGAGGSWLDAKVFGQAEGARPSANFVGPMPGVDAQGIGGWNPSWGQLLQGIGGIASGALMATQKGATTGQKIGGGLTAAGGVAAMIPGGQIVGGVMMAAGALLSAVTGAKDRGTAYSRSNITLGSNGKYALGSYDADNNGDPTKFNADAAKIAKGLNDIMTRLNLTAGRGDSFIDTKDKSAEQAALELLKGMRSGVPEISYAIAHETATSLDEMLSHLEFANSFQTQLRALRSSLSDLVTQFQSGVDAGNALGKSLLDFVDNAQSVFKVSAGAKLPGFASGTVSAPSGLAVVGEDGPEAAKLRDGMALLGKSGPELVHLQGGERIWNAHETAQMLASLGEGRDDTLIHLRGSDELAAVQRALGTSGRVNPATGLLGFDDGDAASGHGGENAGHGETNSSTAGRDSAYGGGWGDTGRGSGGALSAIADTVSDLSAAVTDTLASFAGWQASSAAATQEQTAALAGVAGLSMTAVASTLSAIASTVGPSISGMIESLTGVKGTAPAVSADYGDMSPNDFSGVVGAGVGAGGTIGDQAVQAAGGGGAYRGLTAQDINATVASLSTAIKADPTLTGALIGSMRVGTDGVGGTVDELARSAVGLGGLTLTSDVQSVIDDLDQAVRSLTTAGASIPDALRQARDNAVNFGASRGFEATGATEDRRSAQLQDSFDAVGLVKSRVAELNGIVVALGNNTFSPIGKDFDALAADMRRASQAYVAAGQAVPDGLYGAMQQMLALGAVKKRLLDEVAGVTVETSPEQKAVEQLRGKWSTASTDLVKAFSTVGIVGDELAAKLQEGFGNALKKEQVSYGKSLDTGLRKAKGEEGYDSAVALIDSYKTALQDVNALWPEGADRATQAAKVTATLTASMSGLVKSGSITDASLQDIVRAFADTPDAVNAATAALTDLNKTASDTAAEAAQTARNSAVQSWRSVLSSSLSTTTSLASQWQNLHDTLQKTRLSNLLGDYSPLTLEQRYLEAQRQWRDTLAIANDNTPTDAESLAAADKLSGLSDAYLKASKDYWASAKPGDFLEVQEGFSSMESVAHRQLTTAQSQLTYLQSMDATLKSLDSAATEQSRMEQIVATPRKWGATDQVGANMQLALKTGYMGDFGGGGWQAWIVQQSDSVKTIARTVLTQLGQGWRVNGFQTGGIVGAYEDGGLVGNGLWGVDSVVARYAGGGAIALAGGEGVLTARATAAIGGAATIDYINDNGALPFVSERPAPETLLPPARPVPASGGDSAAVLAELRRQNALLEEQNRLLRRGNSTAGMVGDRLASRLDTVSDTVRSEAARAAFRDKKAA